MTEQKKQNTAVKRVKVRVRSSNPRKRVSSKRKAAHPVVYGSTIPRWKFYLVVLCMSIVAAVVFYAFCVRPYAYRWRKHEGPRQYGVFMPIQYDIHGLDISHYQGRIDWDTVRAYESWSFPLRFVFIKATEGGDMQDEMFDYNFEQTLRHGYVRGAYQYVVPQTCRMLHAMNFVGHVQLQAGDLPPVLDVETIAGRKTKSLQQDVRIWLEKVEQHYGVKPILYTSYKFRERYLKDSVFNSYPYWIAHYYVDTVRYEGKWHFWQHTDIASVRGIPNLVDMNVFNGTEEEFSELLLK